MSHSIVVFFLARPEGKLNVFRRQICRLTTDNLKAVLMLLLIGTTQKY